MLQTFFRILFAAALTAGGVDAATTQNFDNPGSTYQLKSCYPAGRPAEILPGGPTGNYLRLGSIPATNANIISFERTDAGAFSEVVTEFDFRISTHAASGRGDGLGFALLKTSVYGAGVDDCNALPPFAAEEPNFDSSLGIGFDIFQSSNPPPTEINNNHLSVHFSAAKVADFKSPLNLASGQWIHARITVRADRSGNSQVTVVLTQCGQQPVTVIDQFTVTGMAPYESRVWLGSRSGGESANFDLDNLSVQYSNSPLSLISFRTSCYAAFETGATAALTVTRTGNPRTTATVGYATSNLSALAGSDYTAASGLITFNAGETTKTLTVPILNDGSTEGQESFLVTLSGVTGAVLGGPAVASVAIIDDESAKDTGYWGFPFPSQITAVHLHMLPDGTVLYWPGDSGEGGSGGSHFENPRIWNPATGTIQQTPAAPHNLFCSGHSFTSDGKLLIAGGHEDTNVGLPDATLYDPAAKTWLSVPDMNAGRWYPTNTTLANGDVLVTSGDISPNNVNRIPQVWTSAGNAWRDLTCASFPWPLYPFMFLAPNGKVFHAGPNRDTQYVDITGCGSISRVADTSVYRADGAAVMFDVGKILLAGGSDGALAPLASTETIDLNAAAPLWTAAPSMNFARKYHNLALLPDGSVLTVGGSGSPGFNDAALAVLEAERWDPSVAQGWAELAPMSVQRLYHSTAVLLPDGRVLVGGGGQPAPAGQTDNLDFQIFWPPYLFKGVRPAIGVAPASVTYGQVFTVNMQGAASTAKVTWIRLPSTTHAFDQNQRLNRLTFTTTLGGLHVTAPASPSLAPPGHYLMFVVNGAGVPSVGRVVKLS